MHTVLTYTRQPRTARYWLIRAHDLVVAALSLPAAALLRLSGDQLVGSGSGGPAALPAGSLYAVPIFVVIAAVVFRLTGMSRGLWRHFSFPDLVAIVKSATIAILIFVVLLFLVDRLEAMPRSVPLLQWLLLVGGLVSTRLLYSRWLMRRGGGRPSGGSAERQPVLLVGAGDSALLLIEALAGEGSSSTVVGVLDPRPGHQGRSIGRIPILGTPDELEPVLDQLGLHGVHPRRILVTATSAQLPAVAAARLKQAADRHGVELARLADLLGQHELATAVAAEADPVLHPSLAVKRGIDVAISLVLLGLTAPLMGLIAVLVHLGLGDPVLFRQIRPGRHGRAFMLYKFRTLREPRASAGDTADTARECRVGRLLRRSRLDELPQLWNVLRGEMSLIGPRPLLPRDLPAGEAALCRRASVRPGITGWAQVNGGHRLSPQEKLALDLWYIRHRTIGLDARILGRTLTMMVLGERVNADEVQRALTVVPAE